MQLSGINGAAFDYGPVLSDDQLRLYFDSDRSGQTHIYFAERTGPTGGFSAPAQIAGINSTSFDGNSTVTADELTILFSSKRSNPGCLFEATRPNLTAAWGTPVRRAETCTTIASSGPSISADGLRLYFNSEIDGNGEGDLYYAERSARGTAFGTPVRLAGFDTNRRGYPTLSEDELTLWYEQGDPSQLKVFEVHRATRADAFGPATRVDWMGSDSEADPGVTHDGRAMVFMSDRSGGGDLYTISRACQ